MNIKINKRKKCPHEECDCWIGGSCAIEFPDAICVRFITEEETSIQDFYKPKIREE